MRAPANNKFWLVSVLSLLAVVAIAVRSRHTIANSLGLSMPSPANTLSTLPPVMLWAWERPENLDFIDTSVIGVAFLAKTIYLRGDRVLARPRLQSLNLREGTKLVAVLRIESDHKDLPALSATQIDRTAIEVTALAKLPNVTAVQIDFDAKLSERDFYRQLLTRVRRDLPPAMPLSITALASWCAGDRWLSDLPVNEVVPMFFRLGVERRQFESRLKSGEQVMASPCRVVAGVSIDEVVATSAAQRLYIFSPTAWTPDSLNIAMEAYKR